MVLFFSLTLFSAIHLAATATGPVVDLGYARYEGVLDSTSNNTHYLGIRFAAPPTGISAHFVQTMTTNQLSGSLRFAAPKAPALVQGIQPADTIQPECWQAGFGVAPSNPYLNATALAKRAVAYSEDCLFLKYVPFFGINCTPLMSV